MQPGSCFSHCALERGGQKELCSPVMGVNEVMGAPHTRLWEKVLGGSAKEENQDPSLYPPQSPHFYLPPPLLSQPDTSMTHLHRGGGVTKLFSSAHPTPLETEASDLGVQGDGRVLRLGLAPAETVSEA